MCRCLSLNVCHNLPFLSGSSSRNLLAEAGMSNDVLAHRSGTLSTLAATPEALPELIHSVGGFANLRLLGLMTMPPWSDDPEATRPYFRRLRALAEQHHLKHLSMGMSHDLEAAIEEGSTCVRVGTALFGKRKKEPV